MRKQTTGRTDDGRPVHSFQTLPADLGTCGRIDRAAERVEHAQRDKQSAAQQAPRESKRPPG
jgi:hypothetical protein